MIIFACCMFIVAVCLLCKYVWCKYCTSSDAMIPACCLFLVYPINGLDTNADWHGRNKSSKTKPPTRLKNQTCTRPRTCPYIQTNSDLNCKTGQAGRLLVCQSASESRVSPELARSPNPVVVQNSHASLYYFMSWRQFT